MRKIIPCLLVVALATIAPGVTTWIADDAGDWHDPESWDNGVPLPDMIANFYKANVSVTAQSDLTVTQAMVNAAGVTTFDLGDNTLFVNGRFDVGGNAAAGYAARPGAGLKVVSGTIDAGTNHFYVGASVNNTAVSLENTGALTAGLLQIGATSRTGNRVTATGPAIRLNASSIVLGGGKNAYDNTLVLRDCAVTNTSVTIGSGGSSRGCGVTLERAMLTTESLAIATSSGASGTTMLLFDSFVDVLGSVNSGQNGSTFNLLVSNSVMNVAGNFGLDQINGGAKDSVLEIYRDPDKISRVNVGGNFSIGYGGPNSRVVVNGGTLEIKGWLHVNQEGNGTYNAVLVSNGTFSVAGATTIGYQKRSTPRYSHIELTGADARFNTSSVLIGNSGEHHYLYVNGGTAVITNALTIGTGSNTNRVVVSAATSRIEAGSITARAYSEFVFTIPDEGFARPPVFAKGNASLNATTRFFVHADGFLGRTVLMEAARITELDNANFTFSLRPGTRAILYQNGKTIEVRVVLEPSALIIR